MRLDFRTLKAEEIECRVGQINAEGFTLLLYKDARCDMNLLDEVCSKEDWQRDHKEIKGNLYCGVSIYDHEKQCWVTKWDCGTESYTEKEKGEASDSFKRACVNWGIGRELYSAPHIKIKGFVKKSSSGKLSPDFWSIKVAEIAYNDKREISKLVIMGDREVIFEFGTKGSYSPKKQTTETPPETPKTEKKSTSTTSDLKCSNCGANITTAEKRYSEEKFGKALCRKCQKDANKPKTDDYDPLYDDDLPFN